MSVVGIHEAVASLYPDADFSGPANDGGYDDIRWHKPKPDGITEAKVQTELDRLNAEWTAQEYARNRKKDYPDTGEQFNKIYDDGIDKWKSEMVDPVKTKWPKDNSGPV